MSWAYTPLLRHLENQCYSFASMEHTEKLNLLALEDGEMGVLGSSASQSTIISNVLDR